MRDADRARPADLLARALRHICSAHHDALRLRFGREAGDWRSVPRQARAEPVPFHRVDLRGGAATRSGRARLEQAAAEAQASLDLAHGPLLRVVLFDLGAGGPAGCCCVVHHLVVDGVSWRILLEDLLDRLPAAAGAATAGGPAAQDHLLQHWARAAGRARQSPRPRGRSCPSGWRRAGGRPAAAARPAGQARTPTRRRPVADGGAGRGGDRGAAAGGARASTSTQINDVLLTALAQALRGAGPAAAVLLVDLEGHGREELFDDVDLSRTVGWFTTLFPVLLEVRASGDPGQALAGGQGAAAADAQPRPGLRAAALPGAGTRRSAEQLRACPQAEVCFNYLGQFDRGLPAEAGVALAASAVGARADRRRAPAGGQRRRYGSGRLQLAWTYSAEPAPAAPRSSGVADGLVGGLARL